MILAGLFLVQNVAPRRSARCSGRHGALFITIGAIGLKWVPMRRTLVAANLNTNCSSSCRTATASFAVLGSVLLAVTGAEALYADLGHFGKRAIRVAWFSLVAPALVLNYFGQGALLLTDPSAAESPFYRLVPLSMVVPFVVLSTVAAVIASQALISAVFSLTRQAVQLGYSPRVEIRHTSATTIGQIYVPSVNRALAIATIALVIGFQSSSALAPPTASRSRRRWGSRRSWRMSSRGRCGTGAVGRRRDHRGLHHDRPGVLRREPVEGLHGGWVPLVIATLVFSLLSTWKTGRMVLGSACGSAHRSICSSGSQPDAAHRVPGTAIFMTGSGAGVPPTLIHNLRHNKVLHANIVLLTVTTEDVPHVSNERAIELEPLSAGFFRVTLRYGFMEEPSVPEAISDARARGLPIDKDDITYFLGRETLLPANHPGMAPWREKLFALMSRNAMRATAFFRIPPERVVELGMQVEL